MEARIMRKSIQAVITKLEAISHQVEGYAENARDQEREDRANKLYEEVQCIEDALEALNSIE